jgi:ubiquitin carboxyl-terminal hydrolase 8
MLSAGTLKPSGVLADSPPTPTTPVIDKPLIPVTNTASPKELLAYMRNYNVLLLDVRNRADFEKEHIKAGAVACVEPSVLMREK